MSVIELRALVKTYPDGTQAVRGIDLATEPGELVVLLGPSGCGKTTTLRMIAGLERADAGQVLIAGEDVTQRSPGERDIGFVFQFYALYPHLSVAENVAFPLRAAGLPAAEREARMAAVVDRLGLAPLLRRRPRQLSGGDQQRVSLARAMVRRPRVWLMDEPLGTLDHEVRLELRSFIREQQQDLGVPTVYVTHDQEEAMAIADRVVVMDGGRILQAGTRAEVYDRPANLFVARFVGSPGMNLLEGVVRDGRFVFDVGDASGAGARAGSVTDAQSGGTTRQAVKAESVSGATPAGIPAAPGIALPPGVRDGPAVLGVRPEFVSARDDGPLRGSLSLDEYHGDCRYLHYELGPRTRLVRRAGTGERERLDQSVGLDFDRDHLRLFDVASGERLL